MEPDTMKMKAIKGAAFCNIELLNQLLSNETQETFDKILMFVAKEGLKEAAEVVLSHGANINACKEDGKKSVLATAVSKGHKEIVELLLNQGAIRDNEVLDKAIRKERTEILKLLLEQGFDANFIFKDTKTTVLSRAIYCGKKEIVEVFLDHGGHDNEALFDAISFGKDTQILKLLLDKGFDANCVFKRDTVLCYAINWGSKEKVELLLDHGANINEPGQGDKSLIAKAVSRGQKDIVKLLLDRGARRDDRALVDAIRFQKDVHILKLLLERGYDANYTYSVLGISPTTGEIDPWYEELFASNVVFNAIECGSKEMVKLLLDHGANINAQARGTSSLTVAASKGHGEIVKLLLNRGADINIVPIALKTAIEKGNNQICKLLVRQMVLMKSANLYVSESNWALLNADLLAFQKECDIEIKLLKSEQFNDFSLSFYDFLKIEDIHRLAILARNENNVKLLESEAFKKNFLIYGDMIVEHFEKGKSRNEDFESVKTFFNHLATRKSDRLPRMPFTFLTELFTYLSSKDVDNLKEAFEI